MSAVVVTPCCCGGKQPNYLYHANKCVEYNQNPCVHACGECCEGVDPPVQISFCDWYLVGIGFTLPFNPLNCYFVEYRGCTYLINQTPDGPCPVEPPAGVYNEGTFKEVRAAGGNPCCPTTPPTGECVNDLIVEAFAQPDPWGVHQPVIISSLIGLCCNRPGTDVNLCYRPGEFLEEKYEVIDIDTTQEVGKCFERGNPDAPVGPCTAAGQDYLTKITKIEDTETFKPCDCSGNPGFLQYSRTFMKCYGSGECAGWYCPGFCDDDPGYADCVANRYDCTSDADPMDSYELTTLYKIIKAYTQYPCGGDGQPDCECAYYSDDAIRITFPLCYAIQAGLDPFDPADANAIKSLYMSKVEAFNICDEVCAVEVGTYGTQVVPCIKICGLYKVEIFSGSAGHVAAAINTKMNPEISAASLNSCFWFGYRQGVLACGGDPNVRPPYAPGDLIEVDRAEISTLDWKVRVFIKGYSPRFRFCASQTVSNPVFATSVAGVSVCMSTNAVSPAEWACGLRPNMAAVRNDCYYVPSDCPNGFQCQEPAPGNPADCSSAGTYPQFGEYSGAPPTYTPGYSTDFQNPCGTAWLDVNCKLWECTYPGATCAQCASGTAPIGCCDCSFGVGPPGCIGHTLQCSVPSNTTLSIT